MLLMLLWMWMLLLMLLRMLWWMNRLRTLHRSQTLRPRQNRRTHHPSHHLRLRLCHRIHPSSHPSHIHHIHIHLSSPTYHSPLSKLLLLLRLQWLLRRHLLLLHLSPTNPRNLPLRTSIRRSRSRSRSNRRIPRRMNHSSSRMRIRMMYRRRSVQMTPSSSLWLLWLLLRRLRIPRSSSRPTRRSSFSHIPS